MASLTDTVLDLLAWVNEKRFDMPWRWSLWSQTFTNVLNHIDNGRTFLKDQYIDDEQKKDELNGEAKSKAIKRIKKRLQIFKEREITHELYRVNQPVATNEVATVYRSKKSQKERAIKKSKSGKPDESRCESEKMGEIDQYVLPLEKIYIAQENKKLYAFCTSGNKGVVRLLFELLKASPKSLFCYRALLDCFTYAD